MRIVGDGPRALGLRPGDQQRRRRPRPRRRSKLARPALHARQYVLAFPYDSSGLAATRPEVLTHLSRVFWEALRHRYRAWAKSAGLPNPSRAETGAVTGVHRAGSSLNLHVHFYTLCADGVYVEEDGGLRFVEATPPTRAELEAMLARIYQPIMKWLNKRGLLRGDDDSHEERELSPTEALAQAAMQRGTLVTVASDADDIDDAEAARPPPSPAKTDAEASRDGRGVRAARWGLAPGEPASAAGLGLVWARS